MIKMIVSSFYNTLINSEEAIPTITMLEIERLREKGIIFSICTNRTYQEVLEYNKDFSFVDYIISLNGSYVYDVSSSKILFKSKLTDNNINKIKKVFTDYKITYYTENNIYNDLNNINEDIYKIEIEIENEEDIEKLNKINVTKSILEKDNKTYLEITTSKSNMFNGVDKVSIKTGIKLNEILVIACNNSDISLITNIKKNYIMKNCDKTLKKLGYKKTTTNDLNGVEKVLKQL